MNSHSDTETEPGRRPAPGGWWQTPRLDRGQRLVGGVAAGIANELGVDPVQIRIAFVVLTVAGGWGIALYGLCWVWLAVAPEPTTSFVSRPKGQSDKHRRLAMISGTLGLLLLIRTLGLGFVDSLVWPVAVLGLGFAVVWHRSRSDETATPGAAGQLERPNILRFTKSWRSLRVIGGLVLAAGGISGFLALNFDLSAARDVSIALAVVFTGLVLLLGPWVWRLINDLTEERRRRIRSEERSDLAAHLHDSVLQTLALIQRHSDDNTTMVNLARRQERELREWLYRDGEANSGRFRGSLNQLAAHVEERHGVPMEVVIVGDIDVDERVEALLGATREAAVNAARHSGTAQVDIYAEVGETSVEVFIRDTGCGFDPSSVTEDRRGLADSIHQRMTRRGGRATISSAIGEGTEVELHLPLEKH